MAQRAGARIVEVERLARRDDLAAGRDGRPHQARRALTPLGAAMFERWGRTMVRRRWWVIGAALAFMAFGGIWGTEVFGALITEGSRTRPARAPGPSSRAEETLGRTGNDVVVLYRSADRDGRRPGVRAGRDRHAGRRCPTTSVDRDGHLWSTTTPGLVSDDRHATYAVLTLAGDDETERGGAGGDRGRAGRARAGDPGRRRHHGQPRHQRAGERPTSPGPRRSPCRCCSCCWCSSSAA